jgi:hypothetical protein
VKDLHVRCERPHLLRQLRAQLFFDLHRIVAFGDADAVRDTQHVTVDRKTRNAERMAQDDVRRLAAHARELREQVHVSGDVAAMLGHELLRHTDQRLGLLTEEAGRQDLRLELAGGRLRQRTRVGVAFEECRRDDIHARVG